MSKVGAGVVVGDDVDTAAEVEDTSECQPLRTMSHEGEVEAVDDFVAAFGLEEHLHTFQNASLVRRVGSRQHDLPSLPKHELNALSREDTHKWRQPKLLYFTIVVCALGAVEQGFAQTGMNGANLYIPKALGIDHGSTRDAIILGLINCGIYLAQGLCGAAIAEPINNRIGRRGAIFLASALCLIGNVGSALSSSWPVLVLCRLILGTGLGLNSSSINVYAAESAPSYIRGGLAVSWQLFTAFGILLGFLANVAFHDLDPTITWRLQLAAPLLPTVPLLLLIYACPESASWHMKFSRYDDAYASLVRLRNTELQAAIELYTTSLSRRASIKLDDEDDKSYSASLLSLFRISRNRHAVYASYTVMLSQQLCGINIIAFYSSTIFLSSGFSPLLALWASVIFGAINFLGAVPAIWSMDTFGRRRLILWTLPPMALTMLLAALSFNLPPGTARVTVLSALIYIFCALYSPGMGPVPCAYSAEVFPLDAREMGMSFAIATASIWATVLSLTFPALLDGLGEQGSFGLYAGLNVVAWVLCWTFVRETKGVRLEEMDAVFAESAVRFLKERWYEGVGRWFGKRDAVGGGWEAVAQDEGQG